MTALFTIMYTDGLDCEETVFKYSDELNAQQAYDYIYLVKNNKEAIEKMYEKIKRNLDGMN
jgi:hypothetical protein